MQLGHGFHHAGSAPPLHAHLYCPIVLAGGRNHLLTFPGIVAARLFDVDVFARGARQNCRGTVPMIGRFAKKRVHFAVIQNSSEVRDCLWVLLAVTFQLCFRLVGTFGIDVADILDDHAGLFLQCIDDLHAPVQPHDPEGHLLAGQSIGLKQWSGSQSDGGSSRRSQKISA